MHPLFFVRAHFCTAVETRLPCLLCRKACTQTCTKCHGLVKLSTGHGFNEHLYGHDDTLGDDEQCLVRLVPVCLVTPISFYLVLMGFSLLQKIGGSNPIFYDSLFRK